MMIGVAVWIGPGVKWSHSARCPSWKIQTSAPYEALIDRRFTMTALRGSSRDRSSTKSAR
jgi:hypothetical protein